MDEKTYRLTEKGRAQRVWSRIKFELMIAIALTGFHFFAWIKSGKNPQVTLMLYALPVLIPAIAYRFWEYSGDAKKWHLLLTPESITLDCGERKGSFIKEGAPPVVFQRIEIGEIIDLERSVHVVNHNRTAALEFPKEIESYEEVRSVLEQWKALPKDPLPVAEPNILTRGMAIKYVAIVTGGIAALWYFNHPAVIFPAGLVCLFSAYVLILVGFWPLRSAGIILLASTAYRFFLWFRS